MCADAAADGSPFATSSDAFAPSAAVAATFPVRQATQRDSSELRCLIALSVRELQKNDYAAEQLEKAVSSVFTLDTQLITDGTYFVVENPTASAGETIVACGGWSGRKTLCGGDLHAVRDNAFLDPKVDAAKIRAFFVHPAWARCGLGSRLLVVCEEAARAAGFLRFEMAATLTGVPLYKARGYQVVEETSVPLCGESTLPVVIMARSISGLSKEETF